MDSPEKRQLAGNGGRAAAARRIARIAREGWFNFAIYSASTRRSVRLLLCSAARLHDADPTADLDWTRNKSGPHLALPRCRRTLVDRAHYYAYQIDGPRDVAQGQRFDPDKVLLDPYARAVHFPPGFSRSAACHPGANPGRAPLGVIAPEGRQRPANARHAAVPHTHDAVIYELHVRGFTKRSRIPASGHADGAAPSPASSRRSPI